MAAASSSSARHTTWNLLSAHVSVSVSRATETPPGKKTSGTTTAYINKSQVTVYCRNANVRASPTERYR